MNSEQSKIKNKIKLFDRYLHNLGGSPSSGSLSLKDPERTIPMLRGRSASDSVLPSGDAPYSSREASCVGMLLDRVILGGPPTGLGTVKKPKGSNERELPMLRIK